ncbi:hypothetical protein HPB48_011530 [Haemaphysalis longicornis]|uniref:Peptidase M13 C-terminal domain-containing protein n=1 Tax=Haemaphysalis longicornis TaxID=44386 RepID=A0A9J6G4X8_HAELO|nr:hypothetical protein HPB48_011530 [Haemaphysalis longicornis]
MAWVTSSLLSILEGHFRNLETVLFMTGGWTKGSFRIEQCRQFGCASTGRSAVDVFQKMAAQRQRRHLESKRRLFTEFPDDFFDTEIRVVDENYLTVPVGVVRSVFHKDAFWEYHLSRIVLQLSAALIDVFRNVVSEHAERYKDLHGRFFAAEHCLHEGQVTMKEATSVPFTSNGTAEEDLRDMLAVAAAHRILRRFSSPEAPLQGLPGLPFDAEQLFFVHIALNRCEKYDATYEDQLLRHGRRAHAAYRVNGPLRQSIAFSKAFHCRQGSYMNPRLKCVF